jgi:sugar phosphate isomerase/epimerase
MTTSRRVFLQSVAVAAAGVALPAPAAAETPFRLRCLLASALYGNLPLEQVLPEVARAGCVGLDLWGKAHATHREEVEGMGADRFEALLRRHQVRLVCSTRYPLGPFGLQPEMPLVQRLGGSLIVCDSRGPKTLAGAELKAAVKEFLEQMKPHADAAARHGITLAIENHGNALLNTPDSLRYWAEFNRHPALGVAFAPHHLHAHVGEMPKLIRDLGAANLPFLYLQEHGIGSQKTVAKNIELQQLPGRGKLDYRPILRALREAGFRGHAAIFMHPTPRGTPILPTAAEITTVHNEARAHIERCLREIA